MHQPERHFGYLDSLRGIAVLGVLMVHVGFLIKFEGRNFQIAVLGQRGVQLFYMISAFTLFLSLESRREDHALSSYFIRRFFRIAPMFYFLICINLFLRWVAPAQSALRDLRWWDVALGFVFLNGVRPLAINAVVAGGWSVAVETTFYLILPLLFRYINTVKRGLILFAVSAPIASTLSRYLAKRVTDQPHYEYFTFLWFPIEFPIFIMGILCYMAWKQQRGRSKEASMLLLASSAIILWANFPLSDKLYASSFAFIPLILGLSHHEWPLLVNRWTRFLGKISYSFYLLYFLVLQALEPALTHFPQLYKRPIGFIIVYLVALAATIPLCAATWRYIEQPGIRLGRRLIKQRQLG